MIIVFALAISTLGPAPEVPQRAVDDCVRTEPVAQVRKKTHPHKPVKKRLFKSDPKPIIEEGCETLPPAAPLPLFEDVDYGYSVPLERIDPPDVPVPPVQSVETPECGCFGFAPGSPVSIIERFGAIPVVDRPAAHATPIPEPGSWLVIGVGLLVLRWKAKKSNFLPSRK